MKEAQDMKENNSKLLKERDAFRADTRELYRNKKVVENAYAHDKNQNAEREGNLKKQLTQANKENNEY